VNLGLVLGIVVVLAGYTFLYLMVRLWGGAHITFADAAYRGCP
jgi:hypothetical protein